MLIAQLTRPDAQRPEPLTTQIYRDLLAAIHDGRLAGCTDLPSSRSAAAALGVSRSTINTVYDLLRAEGALHIQAGKTPRVLPQTYLNHPTPVAKALRMSKRGHALAQDPRAGSLILDHGVMSPGIPDEALFDADEWARLLRRAARKRYGPTAAYDDFHGSVALRTILSRRLATDRGVRAHPDQILITPGTQASLTLATQVMTDPGDLAALEDPGFLGARGAFIAAGLSIAPLGMDSEGIRLVDLPQNARLIYVTPANHHPLGVRLSLARRLELLQRAAAQRAVIIEDDYDSEFIWNGRELGALAAEPTAQNVLYLGSVSKVLMPALRVGWMVVPHDLITPFRTAQRQLGLAANIHAQMALAEMMESGRYRAHLRRIAKVYEARGRALADAVNAIKGVQARPPDGGVQLAIRIDTGLSEHEAVKALAAQGFRVARLSSYCLAAQEKGLVVGFAEASPERIDMFAKVLSNLVDPAGDKNG